MCPPVKMLTPLFSHIQQKQQNIQTYNLKHPLPSIFSKRWHQAGMSIGFVCCDSIHVYMSQYVCVCAPLQLVLCLIASLPPAWNSATSLVPWAPSSTSRHVGTHAGSDPRSGVSIPSSSPPWPRIDTGHWMRPSAVATCEWMTQSVLSKLWNATI